MMALPSNRGSNNNYNNGDDDNTEGIQLLGRCALCLEKAASPKDRTGRESSTRQRGPSQLSSKSFDINKLWHLIIGNVENESVYNYDIGLGATKSDGQGISSPATSGFALATVPVCESCHMNLSKLKNIYSEFLKIKESLQAQIKTVKNVITQSGIVQEDGNFSGRLKTLHEALQRSSFNNELGVPVTPNCVEKTLEFLCRLRGQPPPPPPATHFLSNDDDYDDLHFYGGDDDDDPSKGQEEFEDVKDVKPHIENLHLLDPQNDPGDSNPADGGTETESNSNSEDESRDNGSNDSDSDFFDYEPPAKLKRKLKLEKIGTKRKRNTSPNKAEGPPMATATGRRKRTNICQRCEVCNRRYPDMATHLKKHGLKDFISTCPNPICDLAYLTPMRLNRVHLQANKDCLEAANLTWDDVTILKCDSCQDFQTKNKFLFKQHLKNSHEQGESNTKPFRCPLAPPTGNCELELTFNMKQSVEMHLIEKHLCIRNLNLDLKRKCCVCHKFIQLSGMEDHLRNDHGLQEIFKCRQCPFVFDTWERLMAHKRRFHSFRGEEELSCDLCPIDDDQAPPMFSSISSLRNHYFKEHGLRENEKLFQCDKCDQAFPTSGLLLSHKKQKRLAEIQKQLKMGMKPRANTEIVRCKECPSLQFRSQEALDTHNVRRHGGTPFECPHCHHFYDSERSFSRHVREKHDPNRKPRAKHMCEKCGKEFYCPSELAYHDEIVHQGKKTPFQCTQCEKSFRYKNGLKRHVRTIHENVREHVCASCGRAFPTATQLNQHTRVHTREKPFGCEECGKKFSQKGSLTMHQRKVHANTTTAVAISQNASVD